MRSENTQDLVCSRCFVGDGYKKCKNSYKHACVLILLLIKSFVRRLSRWRHHCVLLKLKHWRQRPRGQRLIKTGFILYFGILQLSRSVLCAYGAQALLKLKLCYQRLVPNEIRKIRRHRMRCQNYAELDIFTLLFSGGQLGNVPRIKTNVHSYCFAH